MHRKGHTKKHRMTRRKHRGGYYGASGQIEGAPGAMKWSAGSEMGGFAVNRAGNATYGAGRRRKHSKKTRRHRKMRGGNKFGGVAASFQGSGTAGMADFGRVSSRGPAGSPVGGAFNNYGAGPGSGYGSFVKAH